MSGKKNYLYCVYSMAEIMNFNAKGFLGEHRWENQYYSKEVR